MEMTPRTPMFTLLLSLVQQARITNQGLVSLNHDMVGRTVAGTSEEAEHPVLGGAGQTVEPDNIHELLGMLRSELDGSQAMGRRLQSSTEALYARMTDMLLTLNETLDEIQTAAGKAGTLMEGNGYRLVNPSTPDRPQGATEAAPEPYRTYSNVKHKADELCQQVEIMVEALHKMCYGTEVPPQKVDLPRSGQSVVFRDVRVGAGVSES